MITQQQDPLTSRDRLIIQTILKQVENHDIPTESIVTFYINEVGEVDGQPIKTVVVVTKSALYSFGYDYFKQLTREIRHQFAVETTKSTSSSLVARENVLICQAILSEVEGVDIALEDIIGFQSHHLEMDGEWHRTVLITTKNKLYSLERNLFKRLRSKYRKITRAAKLL